MGIADAIAAVAGAVKSFLGLQSKKLDLKNTAPVQAAAQAQQSATEQDKANAAVAGQDAAEVRKELAE